MTTALRVSCIAYMVAVLATLALLFGLQQPWPEPAVLYYQWFHSQPRGALLSLMPYFGLVLLGVSWLSAGLLLLGKAWTRWAFVVVVATMLLLNLLTALLGQPPFLLPSIESALSDLTSVLAGLVIGLSFWSPGRSANAAL